MEWVATSPLDLRVHKLSRVEPPDFLHHARLRFRSRHHLAQVGRHGRALCRGRLVF